MWYNITIEDERGKMRTIRLDAINTLISELSKGVGTIYLDCIYPSILSKKAQKFDLKVSVDENGKLKLIEQNDISEIELNEINNRLQTLNEVINQLKKNNVTYQKLSVAEESIYYDYIKYADSDIKRQIYANLIIQNNGLTKKCLRIISELDEYDFKAIEVISKILFFDFEKKTKELNLDEAFFPVIFTNAIGIDKNIHFYLMTSSNNNILYPQNRLRSLQEDKIVFCDGILYFSHYSKIECMLLTKEGVQILKAMNLLRNKKLASDAIISKTIINKYIDKSKATHKNNEVVRFSRFPIKFNN